MSTEITTVAIDSVPPHPTFQALDSDVERPPAASTAGGGTHLPGTPSSSIQYIKAPILPLEFKNVVYTVTVGSRRNKTQREILKGVSGTLRPGRLTAIMGSSGAGKTTLLNVISGRLTGAIAGSNLSGSIMLNGVEVSKHDVKHHSAYVLQEDVFYETLTPYELLLFSARLRLPQTISDADKIARVEQVLKELGLEGVRNTMIGGVSVKGRGLSGGEKKRLSIGVELITNPSILFLDEPTTGLDSLTAFHVIDTVRKMAHLGNRTVVCTIHQPSSEIFELFDDLILMVNGHLIYSGPAKAAVPYFASQGFRCPEYSNPADYFMMEIMHFDAADPADVARIDPLVAAQLKKGDSVPEDIDVKLEEGNMIDWKGAETYGKSIPALEKGAHASIFTETRLLLWRSLVHFLRQPMTTKLRLAQNIFMSLIVGLLYLRIGNTYSTVKDRQGAIFIIMMNNFMTSFSPAMLSFSVEKLVFVREQGNSMYSPGVYFIGKLFSELPFQLVFPLVYSSISYFLVGFQADSVRFVRYLVTLMILVLAGQGLGLLVAAIAPSAEVALSFMPIIMMPLVIFSGLFIDINSIPVWLRWISYISPFRYVFRNVLTNEFENLVLTCSDSEWVVIKGVKKCLVTSGNQVISAYGFSPDDYSYNMGITGVIAVVATLLAFIVLVVKSRKAT
eukprot:TRINITY_DN21992_c0_g1_i1.p1 TRINITY_DN21992_c0_g1~~TRINITY_DN21992_c0_g1_i1.p1  ORF type:complete len:674 (-),score=211.74 TRINITY_DN21992_c0_g1_i1:46-2067(-)